MKIAPPRNEELVAPLQERLPDPSILCGENDKVRLIDFDDTIDEFAARKARRKMF